MTKHRIEADKVVIERDRRIEECGFQLSGDHRSVLHNYSQPHKIIYVPVEPQPYELGWSTEDAKKYAISTFPFHPDDTLILLEEWFEIPDWDESYEDKMSWEPITVKRFESMGTVMVDKARKHSTSTMPPSLDSQCQQLTVVKTLGVEEKMIEQEADTTLLPAPTKTIYREIWNWKLLTTVK